MTLVPANADYTDKDFDAINARLRNLIRSVFPAWTEESVANFGNMLVELNAHTLDTLMFYVDKWVRESRIATAELRRSLLNLCALIGFVPLTATAAIATETFTLQSAAAGDVLFPVGAIVKTAGETGTVKFQLLTELTIFAGALSTSGTVENSESEAAQFVSTGTPNQRFELPAEPFLQGSAVVTAGDGSYAVVDNLLSSTSTDKHFTATVGARGRAVLLFGNGSNGQIPSGTISVSYKTGGGAIGALEAGALSVMEGSLSDSLGTPVVVTVTNAAKTTGGTNQQTNAQIRQLAPLSLRVLERVVAREDYEIVAMSVPGVGRALMLFKNQEASIAENAGILFIVPDAGGTPSQALLDDIRSRMEQVPGYPSPTTPKSPTMSLGVQTASFLAIDHEMTLYKRPGVLAATMKANVTATLARFYSPQIAASQLIADDPGLAASLNITVADGTSLVANPRVGFGFQFQTVDGVPSGVFPWSDVHNVVRDVPEVARVEASAAGFSLNGLRASVSLQSFQFPTLGTIQIRDGDTGLLI